VSSSDDDRFREPGSRYEHEEPVAVAVIDEDAPVDWSDSAHSPSGTLWLPETLFHQLAMATRLGGLDLNGQTRLTRQDCRTLAQELLTLEATTQDADVHVAATLVRKRAEAVVSVERRALLVEGP